MFSVKIMDEYDEDEEYVYEEDGEYGDENEASDDAKSDTDDIADDKGGRESGGSAYKATSTAPSSAEKKAVDARALSVPSDNFNILDISEIVPIMNSLVEDVSSLLDLNCDVTQSLLQANKWDREKLIDAFFANPDKVLKKAGVDLYSDTITDSLSSMSADDKASGTSSTSNGQIVKCRICYDETSSSFSMGCGHKFCRPCYSEYLCSQVNDGQTCIIAHCPEFKCSQVVTAAVFQALLGNRCNAAPTSPTANDATGTPTSPTRTSGKGGRLVDVYNAYFVRNFIETCKNMKYCPAPGCEKVAVGSGITTVRCACGHPFCMRCGECM